MTIRDEIDKLPAEPRFEDFAGSWHAWHAARAEYERAHREMAERLLWEASAAYYLEPRPPEPLANILLYLAKREAE